MSVVVCKFIVFVPLALLVFVLQPSLVVGGGVCLQRLAKWVWLCNFLVVSGPVVLWSSDPFWPPYPCPNGCGLLRGQVELKIPGRTNGRRGGRDENIIVHSSFYDVINDAVCIRGRVCHVGSNAIARCFDVM